MRVPGIKRKNSNKGIAKARKERKRAEAELRAAAYANRPFQEKLKGAGKKEREKLEVRNANDNK